MILNMVQCGVLSPASFFHIRSDFQRHIIACSSAVTNSSSSSNSTPVDQQYTTNSSNSSRLSAAELCSVREKREPAVWETEDEPPALVVNPGKSRPQRSRPTATNRGCGGQGRPAGGQLLVFGGGSPLLLSPKRGSGSGSAAVRCLAAASGNNNVMRGLWGPPDDKEFANFIRHVTNRVHFSLMGLLNNFMGLQKSVLSLWKCVIFVRIRIRGSVQLSFGYESCFFR